MSSYITEILKDLGLGPLPDFIGDRLYIAALIIAIAVWGILWPTVMPTFRLEDESVVLIIFTGIIWSPLLEEILFRGVLQGFMLKKTWGNTKFLHLTQANWVTSFVFVFAHFWYQPAIWAFMVLMPSLAFGFFRDRYDHTFPGILLHAFYNGGFLLVNLMSQ